MTQAALWWAKLEAADVARGQVVREAFLGPLRRRRDGSERSLLVHIPAFAGEVSLIVFSDPVSDATPALHLRPLGRLRAAVHLLSLGWRKLPASMRGQGRGLAGRVRAVLGQAPARAGEAPPYAVWIDLFDRWGAAEMAALPRLDGSIQVALVSAGTAEAAAATRASVPASWPVRLIDGAPAWAGLSGDWILVLGAGEVLAPHAAACFTHAVLRAPQMRGFCADFDHIGTDSARHRPCLLPPPDAFLLRAGFFPRGAALFRREAHAAVWPALPSDADRARLNLARAGTPETLHRIPLILTHCPDRVLPEGWMQQAANVPSPAPPAPKPLVSIIMPSSCRSRHVLHCLRRVLQKTDYPAFEVLLVVSSTDPSDRKQAGNLQAAARLPHVRVIVLNMPVFNFSAVNNTAVGMASGEFLLFLNDDVVPESADWLSRMVAYICSGNGSSADIVGNRLLYGNGTVQHGGVIMGLANLCEHAFRLAKRADSGPHGLALLDRRVSAVTAACMLVRRQVFLSLGGFDEAYAIALNDVDFCLRAGQAGACIVFAARVELFHFESLSLGRHYQGARAHLEAMEVHRLRSRWAACIERDRFYNPLASLELGREFDPGFPPRQTPLSWITQEPLALH